MFNISQVILARTNSNLCRKQLTVHWSAPNSLIRSYPQPCTNSMWGDESEAVATIIWLYQTVDAWKEEVLFPNLLITLRRYVGTIASQITSLTFVYSTVYSGADQRKHQSSASLAFVRGIHRGPVNSPHKWPVITRKMFPFDDVIIKGLWPIRHQDITWTKVVPL